MTIKKVATIPMFNREELSQKNQGIPNKREYYAAV